MMEPGTLATARLPQLESVSFRQRLNEQLPLDTAFTDELGRPVTLAQYVNGQKPVILAFVYYSCPMLCTQIMNGVSRAVKVLPFSAGNDFDVVFISFDPRDKPEAASAKKSALMNYWSMQNQSGAWHFLTGEEPQIKEPSRRRRGSCTMGREDAAVRPLERGAGAHARRTAVALLLRYRVLAQGAPAGAGGVGAGPNRIAGRRAAALLLSLRSRPRAGTARW